MGVVAHGVSLGRKKRGSRPRLRHSGVTFFRGNDIGITLAIAGI
jgi:hypothetical protein